MLERVGTVAYMLALPPSLEGVHNIFHVSQLRKYVANPSHVLSFEEKTVRPDMTYEQLPVQILDKRTQTLRSREVDLVWVMRRADTPGEST